MDEEEKSFSFGPRFRILRWLLFFFMSTPWMLLLWGWLDAKNGTGIAAAFSVFFPVIVAYHASYMITVSSMKEIAFDNLTTYLDICSKVDVDFNQAWGQVTDKVTQDYFQRCVEDPSFLARESKQAKDEFLNERMNDLNDLMNQIIGEEDDQAEGEEDDQAEEPEAEDSGTP